MSAETTLRAALAALPAVDALVGDRIRPVMLTAGDAYPGVVYKREGTECVNTIENVAVARKVTFDIFCLANTFDDAEELADAVEAVPYVKLDRRADFDPEARAGAGVYASVVTVAVWV